MKFSTIITFLLVVSFTMAAALPSKTNSPKGVRIADCIADKGTFADCIPTIAVADLPPGKVRDLYFKGYCSNFHDCQKDLETTPEGPYFGSPTTYDFAALVDYLNGLDPSQKHRLMVLLAQNHKIRTEMTLAVLEPTFHFGWPRMEPEAIRWQMTKIYLVMFLIVGFICTLLVMNGWFLAVAFVVGGFMLFHTAVIGIIWPRPN